MFVPHLSDLLHLLGEDLQAQTPPPSLHGGCDGQCGSAAAVANQSWRRAPRSFAKGATMETISVLAASVGDPAQSAMRLKRSQLSSKVDLEVWEFSQG